MPADEVTRGSDTEEPRARTGPRHAAPRKPLFTRFHMPAGKAIATVAMPTAVLMGMGFTSTLAIAAGGGSGSPSPSTTAKSLTADEYKDCVKALDDAKDPSASPSPSASADRSESPTPSPSASTGTGEDAAKDSGKDTSGSSSSGSGSAGSDSADSGSADSGSAGKSAPKPAETSGSAGSDSGATTPGPSAGQNGGGLLGTIGDTLGNILTGGAKDTPTASASPTPTATPSASASGSKLTDTVKDTTSKTVKTVGDTVKNTTDTVSKAAGDAGKAVKDTAGSATASPSASADPSASATPSAEDCPAATTAEGGVDNQVPVADDPWYLSASSLLLKGADYQGIVEVRAANGTTKKALKYVVSDGTDIGDLHQTVEDKLTGKTYHVQAAKGSTSTIRDGKTVMYTEKISGNLFGLIPMTFSPDSPPPLNLPLIYFTNVKVTQAAQFGGTLHVPGMHVYTTG
ncbi:hypothetical protein ACIRU5_10025 [Streptomyces misionensis]|uniref:hypothetical protein n=1 Tax=Streptomyces misionensis TaxID=67331 RepID=UPI0038305E40